MRELFVRRKARFDLVNGRVLIVDPKRPRMVTLDSWLELVFQLADGERTLGQIIEHVAHAYDGQMPAGLDQQVIDIVECLVGEGFLELVLASKALPSYLAQAISQQDPAEAKAAMIRDEFITSKEKQGDAAH